MTGLSRRTLLAALGAAVTAPLAASLAGCTPGPGADGLRFATGEVGGLYLEFGELLAAALRRRGADLTVVGTAGSVANLRLLDDRSVDLAVALADAAAHGTHRHVAIGRVYQNYLQCVVRADSGIAELGDLVGRRISIGASESGSALTTRRILELTGVATGLDADTVTEQGFASASAALATGDLAAFFWSGGVPTAKIAQLAVGTPVRLLDLSAARTALDASYPDLYLATEVPAGVYGSPVAVATVGVPNLLLVRPDLPDDAARTLVDVLVEDAESLVPPATVGQQYLTLPGLIDTGSVPLHPAALDRYRERYG